MAEAKIINNETYENDNGLAWDSKDFEQLKSDISKKTFYSDKIDVLEKALSTTTRGFTGHQIAEISALFEYSAEILDAIKLMHNYIYILGGITCKDVLEIFNLIEFSSYKIEILKLLSKMIVDLDNKEIIVKKFVTSSNKKKALEILSNAKPKTCETENDVCNGRKQFDDENCDKHKIKCSSCDELACDKHLQYYDFGFSFPICDNCISTDFNTTIEDVLEAVEKRYKQSKKSKKSKQLKIKKQ